MNDFKEFSFKAEELDAGLGELVKEVHAEHPLEFQRSQGSIGAKPTSRSGMIGATMPGHRAYALCFSECEDASHQWLSYGDRGRGVAIKFFGNHGLFDFAPIITGKAPLHNRDSVQHADINSHNVTGGPEFISPSTIKACLAPALYGQEESISALNAALNLNERPLKRLEEWNLTRARIKSSPFSTEREWRVLQLLPGHVNSDHLPNMGLQPDYLIVNDRPRGVLRLSFDACRDCSPIQEIMLGSACPLDENYISEYVDNHGLFNVKVTRSRTTLTGD